MTAIPAVAGGRMAALLAIGTAWGVCAPLWKIASSAGHSPLGLTVWQIAVTALVLAPFAALRRRRLPLDRAHLGFFAGLGLVGAVLPNLFYYLALQGLSAGVAAITLATVPMLTLMLAALLGLDRPTPRRLAGVGLGFAAVALISAPDSLPQAGAALFLGFAMLTALCYAAEGNFLTLRTPPGLDAVTALLGASVAGLAVALPLALVTGHALSPLRVWGAAEWALTGVSVISAFAYAGYVWLVSRTGPVFAAQVGYVVTLTGVFASVLALGERYTGAVWLALALMIAGLALVQPRPRGLE